MILDDLKATIATLKPITVTTFASSRIFSDESALTFKDHDQVFMVAGPGFWAKVKEQCEPSFNDLTGLGFSGVPIVDMDKNRKEGKRILELIGRAVGVSWA